MPFTINPALPPLVFGLGQSASVQLGMAADSTPAATGWSATGLPGGVTINSSGKIRGAATEAGVFDVVATATGTGPVTDTLAFQIGISDRAGYEAILGGAIEVNMEMRSGYVYVVNTAPGSAENGTRGAILIGKRGDTLQIALGLEKDSELQELIVTDIVLAAKRSEPDLDPIILTNGTFWKTGAYEASRYIFEVPVSGAMLDLILSEEEDEDGTFADLLTEIQVVYQWYPPGVNPTDDPAPTPREIIRTSQEFYFRAARDWISED
jgi:hypothetical protein